MSQKSFKNPDDPTSVYPIGALKQKAEQLSQEQTPSPGEPKHVSTNKQKKTKAKGLTPMKVVLALVIGIGCALLTLVAIALISRVAFS